MKPTATNQKISWFAREHELGTLDLTPDFQRRPVWNQAQASYLIDTILSGIPFPEVYIRTVTSTKGKSVYQVVDGQQRLRSILDFARNDLILEGSDVAPKWEGRSFEDLGDKEKTAFWAYDVVVRDLEGATEGEIRDLFRRLNINPVSLEDQELRHAHFTGRFIKAVELLADDEWWTDNRIVNVQQVRRMQDVEFVSELLVGLIAGPQDKKKTLGSFYEDNDAEFEGEQKWVKVFKSTRTLIESILPSDDLRRWSGKSDFYTLFLVLGQYAEKGPIPKARSREPIRKALMGFRRKVDIAKRKDNVRRFERGVHDYVEAVTRAATDIARRKQRYDVVASLVSNAWRPPA